jgi:hypothetical protein
VGGFSRPRQHAVFDARLGCHAQTAARAALTARGMWGGRRWRPPTKRSETGGPCRPRLALVEPVLDDEFPELVCPTGEKAPRPARAAHAFSQPRPSADTDYPLRLLLKAFPHVSGCDACPISRPSDMRND